MFDNHDAACCGDPQLENAAAELTHAVYPLVLRPGTRGSWLDWASGGRWWKPSRRCGVRHIYPLPYENDLQWVFRF